MFGNGCGGGGDMLWIIILLCLCGDGGFGGRKGCGGNDCCDLILMLILINCLCGNKSHGHCCK